jgi:hypothetical protein
VRIVRAILIAMVIPPVLVALHLNADPAGRQ